MVQLKEKSMPQNGWGWFSCQSCGTESEDKSGSESKLNCRGKKITGISYPSLWLTFKLLHLYLALTFFSSSMKVLTKNFEIGVPLSPQIWHICNHITNISTEAEPAETMTSILSFCNQEKLKNGEKQFEHCPLLCLYLECFVCSPSQGQCLCSFNTRPKFVINKIKVLPLEDIWIFCVERLC